MGISGDKRKLNDSCSSDPEIRKCENEGAIRQGGRSLSHFRISGSELQESFNFRLSSYWDSSNMWPAPRAGGASYPCAPLAACSLYWLMDEVETNRGNRHRIGSRGREC